MIDTVMMPDDVVGGDVLVHVVGAMNSLVGRYPVEVERGESLDKPGVLLRALDMAFGSLKLCLMSVRTKDTKEVIYRCGRVAMYRQKLAPDASKFQCQVCHELFPDFIDHDDREDGVPVVEVPYAQALRDFNCLLYGSVEATTERVVDITRRLLAALPRCPDPWATNGICPRCDYQRNPIPLLELEQTLKRSYWHVMPETTHG